MASSAETGFDVDYWDSMATNSNYLNKGALGHVYGPIQWHKESCALKKVLFNEEEHQEMTKEFEINKRRWLSLKHKNLITVYQVHLEPKALYVVMEFAAGRSLDQVLKTHGSQLKLMIDTVTDWAKQLADGMAYLHTENVVHRDLKSANILLMEPFAPENAMTLKIADYDTIRELHETMIVSIKGTFAWMAPEVLNDSEFSRKSDVWSYGVVIWEMLTGYRPHNGLKREAITLKAMTGQLDLDIPHSIPESYKDLLQNCINKDKEKRPSFLQIIDGFGRNDWTSGRINKKKHKDKRHFFLRFVNWCGRDHWMSDGERANSPRHQLERLEKLREPLLNPQDVSADAIEKAFQNAFFISRGLSGGHIHGPMQYENRQCICERIKFTIDQETQTNEVEITKVEQILSNCRRWGALDHNNLLKFYDVILNSQDIFIVMEYASGGSVRNAMKKCAESGVNIGVLAIKDWATQIAQGMEYLHENNIVHKNLDSVRILIMESFEASNITNKTLKISQFCLIDDNFMSTQAQEKFSFTAPEVFDGIYDKPGDVWSFGIVIWEMLTQKIPYKDVKALTKITQDIRQGAEVLKIPDSCPKALKEILKGCRKITPSERTSFVEIVESLNAWQTMNSPA